jgi:hypothetical protein
MNFARVQRPPFAVIGYGIDVRLSTLNPTTSLADGASFPAGLGLFATRDFAQHDVITIYDGTILPVENLPRFDPTKVSTTSHLVRILS